jgi:hypothetical protein
MKIPRGKPHKLEQAKDRDSPRGYNIVSEELSPIHKIATG